MLTIDSRMVNTFQARSPISFKHITFWCMFLDPHLTIYYLNIGVHMIVVLNLGMSILHTFLSQSTSSSFV